MTKLLSVALVFFLCISVTHAQYDKEYRKLRLQFPAENMVVLKNKETVTVKAGAKGLYVHSDSYNERMYLNNRAGNSSEFSLNYTPLDSISHIEASILVPGKKKYKKIKVKQFKTANELSRSVFYDGAKSISFFYPSMTDGAKTELSYSTEYPEPRLLPSFYFQEYVNVLEAEYSIITDNTVNVAWKLYNMNDTSVQFTQKNDGDEVTYSWKMTNLAAFSQEPNAPGPRCTMPHIIVWIKTAKIGEVIQPILSSPIDLYEWYSKNLTTVDYTPSEEIKSIVDSLLQGKTDEIDKVKSIYSWVQSNIKYLAFEDGMGGFVPRNGKKVCDRRFGDCKDMANMIHTMMEYAKIPSQLTWVGTRGLPYNYEETPTPVVDNHMITTYINKGNYYYLDATGPFTPYDMPSAFIQGKEVMIGFDKDHYEIRHVPVMEASKNTVNDSIELSLNGTRIDGKGKTTFTGYRHIDIAEHLVASSQKQKQTLREYYMRGCNKLLLDSFKLENISDPYKDARIKYFFNLEDYAKTNQDEVYVNMNLNKSLLTEFIPKDRKLEMEKEYEETNIEVITLKIPPGYALEHLPQNASFKNELFGFDLTYAAQPDKIVMTNKMYCNTILLEPDSFKLWNQQMKDLQKAFAEVVILKKTK